MNRTRYSREELSDAARELGRSLARIAKSPQTKMVIEGLERALPDTAAAVKEAMADPMRAAGTAITNAFVDAAKEALGIDRTLSKGIRRHTTPRVKRRPGPGDGGEGTP